MFCLPKGVLPSKRCFAFQKVFCLPKGVLPSKRCFTFQKVFYLPKGVLPSKRCFAFQKVFCLPKGVLPSKRCFTFQKVFYLPKGLLPSKRCFAFQPTAVAVLALLSCCLFSWSFVHRIGCPGVDSHVCHESEAAVLFLVFLINEGALVSATSDSTLHMWNFRQIKPEIIHSVKFQRERCVL